MTASCCLCTRGDFATPSEILEAFVACFCSRTLEARHTFVLGHTDCVHFSLCCSRSNNTHICPMYIVPPPSCLYFSLRRCDKSTRRATPHSRLDPHSVPPQTRHAPPQLQARMRDSGLLLQTSCDFFYIENTLTYLCYLASG